MSTDDSSPAPDRARSYLQQSMRPALQMQLEAVTGFQYPDEMHERRFLVEDGDNPSVIRAKLRAEFDGRCVYCRAPDGLIARRIEFQIEHYRPQSRYPELIKTTENLFYSCVECNTAKRAYDPDCPKQGEGLIPNPCDHRMQDFVRLEHTRVKHVSDDGEFAAEKLRLNSSTQIRIREQLSRLIQTQLETLSTTRKLIIEFSEIVEALHGDLAGSTEGNELIREEIADAQREIEGRRDIERQSVELLVDMGAGAHAANPDAFLDGLGG